MATWSAWVPAAIISDSHPATARVLQYVGGGALFAVTVIFVLLASPSSRTGYSARLTRLRFGMRPWIMIVAIPFAVTGLSVLIDLALGNRAATGPFLRQAAAPGQLAAMAAFLLFFGPLPEELSWRGFGLPLLRTRMGPLPATLVLASVWIVWHLPLFWLSGSYQSKLGVFTPGFWLYLVAAFSTTFLYTWIWEATRSTIAAIILHFMVNFSGEFLDPSLRADAVRTALYAIIACLLAVMWIRDTRYRRHANGSSA
ncbi:MAG: CPBP family intramembrane metalloprotease [Candidatus Krumholzibacteriota bacterium]|nr:CPBP family intramembrane metalloprotease [Candidatus Krumholzibacteriota bacterium]